MNRTFANAPAVLAALAAAGCSTPRTEILLVVGADLDVPAEMDSLRIRAIGTDADGGLDRTFDLTDRLPLTLGLVSAGGRAGPLHVELVGSKNGTPIVERSATTAFVAGKVLVLHLDLQRICAHAAVCPQPHQTCVGGDCVTEDISSSSLAPYPGTTDQPDAASEARKQEAGGDAFDAAVESAGPPDTVVKAEADAPDAMTDARVSLANGAVCATGAACASGQCVDRVCCENACAGACRSCAVTPGKCTLVGVGATDPRGTCTDQGAPSCGTNGRCDGSGACQRYPAPTVCAPERCSATTYIPASTCATGTCLAPSARDCRPGACQAGGCAAPTIVFGAPEATTSQGYTGPEATNFQDGCPSGSVVVGIDAGSDGGSGAPVVAQIATKCGVPSVQNGKVVVAGRTTLPLRGGVNSTLHALDCPPDQIVVGFDGRSFSLLDQLSVRCAPLTLSADGITIGTATDIGPEGGDGGAPFPRTDCGAGMVAVGTNIALRTWIGGFGLVCAPVLLK